MLPLALLELARADEEVLSGEVVAAEVAETKSLLPRR
jgi:hypothetical protein